VLPKTYVASVGWFELVEAHERAGEQREGEEPPGVPTQRTCRRRQQPSHDGGRSMGQRWRPSRCEDSTPRRATREVIPVAAAQPVSTAVVRRIRVELVWPVASLPRGGPHRRNVVDHRWWHSTSPTASSLTITSARSLPQVPSAVHSRSRSCAVFQGP
jgi:hypothetical protein